MARPERHERARERALWAAPKTSDNSLTGSDAQRPGPATDKTGERINDGLSSLQITRARFGPGWVGPATDLADAQATTFLLSRLHQQRIQEGKEGNGREGKGRKDQLPRAQEFRKSSPQYGGRGRGRSGKLSLHSSDQAPQPQSLLPVLFGNSALRSAVADGGRVAMSSPPKQSNNGFTAILDRA